MNVTIRLDPELERRLDAERKRRGVSRSALIGSLVRNLLDREPELSSYEVGRSLGLFGPGPRPRSSVARNAKKLIGRVVRAKHHG